MSAKRSEAEDWNKAERLAIAAKVAPSIRRIPDSAKARRVKTYDQTTTNALLPTTEIKVQREMSLGDAIGGMLRRLNVEIDLGEGMAACTRCAKAFPYRDVGALDAAKMCTACIVQNPPTNCAGWDDDMCPTKPGPSTFTNASIKTRNGRPWRCRHCNVKRVIAENAARFASEERKEIGRKGWSTRPIDQRSRLRVKTPRGPSPTFIRRQKAKALTAERRATLRAELEIKASCSNPGCKGKVTVNVAKRRSVRGMCAACTRRRLGVAQRGRSYTCGHCGAIGHNRRGCTA